MAPKPDTVYSRINDVREAALAAGRQASILIGENAQLAEGSRRAIDSSRKLMADVDLLLSESARRWCER